MFWSWRIGKYVYNLIVSTTKQCCWYLPTRINTNSIGLIYGVLNLTLFHWRVVVTFIYYPLDDININIGRFFKLQIKETETYGRICSIRDVTAIRSYWYFWPTKHSMYLLIRFRLQFLKYRTPLPVTLAFCNPYNICFHMSNMIWQ